MAVTGGCLCGAVRYRSENGPLAARFCWCRDCQYIAAGNATVNVQFPVDGFSVTGPTSVYLSAANSGTPMRRTFCPTCGTPLFSEALTRPHIIIARAGTLDDPSIAQPSAAIWAGSAPHWAHIDPEQPVFDGQPPPPPVKTETSSP